MATPQVLENTKFFYLFKDYIKVGPEKSNGRQKNNVF